MEASAYINRRHMLPPQEASDGASVRRRIERLMLRTCVFLPISKSFQVLLTTSFRSEEKRTSTNCP